jgi:PAS domain S-box-containing protein
LSLEFDRITNQIPIVLWTTDRELNLTSVSGGGAAVLEAVAPNRARPKSLFELFRTDDPQAAPVRNHRKALLGEPVSYEYEFAGRVYDTHLEPLRTAGEISGVIGVATDITDRRKAEQMLRQSEERNRLLIENASDIIYTHDFEGNFLSVSPSAEQITGYAQQEVVKLNLKQIVVEEYLPKVQETIAAKKGRGNAIPHPYELEIYGRDGRRIALEVNTRLAYQDGVAIAIQGIARDITDQKRAMRYRETQFATTRILAESVTLHEAIVSLLEAICRGVDWDFGRMWRRDETAKRLRSEAQWQSPHLVVEESILTPETCLSRHCVGCVVADTGEASWVTDLLEEESSGPEILKAGLRSCFAVPVRHAHETIGVMEFFSRSVRYPDFELLKAMTDIGSQIGLFIERKKAEQALVESEAKFRAVADTASSAIYIHAGDKFLYANRASESITGYSREELLAMPVWKFIYPEDLPLVKSHAEKRVRGEPVPDRYEFRLIDKRDEVRWVDFSGAAIQFGGQSAIVATVFDITDRKRSEKLQSALYRIANLASSATDLNEFYKSIHDIVSELMEARNFYIAVLSEDGERIEAPYFVDEQDPEPPPPEAWRGGLTEYVLRTGKPLLADPKKFEKMVTAGEAVLSGAPSVDWLGVPLKSGDRTFGVLVVQSYSETSRFGQKEADILMFVSQQVASAILQRRSQEALRRSEERYRSQVHSAVYGIYRSSVQGKFLDVNPALVQMLGYDSAEALYAMDMAKDLYADPRERQRYVNEFAKAQRIDGIETRWKRKDGRNITVRLSGRAGLRYPGEPESFEMICEDVTERRMLEEQLLHSQKMEAVGRLAGGVAHDFNNLLTVIKGYSELMLNEVPEKDPMRVEVEEIRRAAERAASLTRQLLAFSRRQVLEPKVVDLNAIIGNMQKLLLRLLGEDVELQVSLSPALGNVKADPGQIEQVIMNLAVNARDAMPRGGKLTVETCNHAIDETYAREHAVVHAGHYAMMAVTDTGIGMDQQTVSHVFEPFFTTKETGKGTGLGLSTVYGIVKQSGGYIWVYSEPGHGTSFKVYLPIVETGKAEETGSRPVLTPTYRGTETILLVEDEGGVRALVKEVLQRHGYRVIETGNGGEALLACEQHPEDIHMLLSDVVLAQMTGTELARRLTPLRPNMKVLFISGYTEEAIIHQGVLEEGTAFLQKPFTPNVLARKVRQVLDGESAVARERD